MGFTRNEVTSIPRGLLHLGSILACAAMKRPSAVHFCGTILRLAPTGRYPASCPVEPGLSSRGCRRQRLSVKLSVQHYIVYKDSPLVTSPVTVILLDIPAVFTSRDNRELHKDKWLCIDLRCKYLRLIALTRQLLS